MLSETGRRGGQVFCAEGGSQPRWKLTGEGMCSPAFLLALPPPSRGLEGSPVTALNRGWLF